MPILDKITSAQNTRVKDVVRMHRSAVRREKGIAIIEGLREISMALAAGLQTDYVMLCPSLFNEAGHHELEQVIKSHRCYEVSEYVFSKMAYREHSDGLLAIMRVPGKQLYDIRLTANPMIIVIESVEKPGNLGAILRTADAAGVDAVIVCDPLTDIYNPNVIRSSVGCVFSKQVIACTSAEALAWLTTNKIEPIAASLKATRQHFECNLTKPIAFIMGSEAEGLTDFWIRNVKTHLKIPMLGTTDSLNVSISAAVLVYEAVRQRLQAGNKINQAVCD